MLLMTAPTAKRPAARFFWIAFALGLSLWLTRWQSAIAQSAPAPKAPAAAPAPTTTPSAAPAAKLAPIAPAATAPTSPSTGFLLKLSLPITGNVDTRLRETIHRLLDKVPDGGPRPILIIEFSPGQSDFGRGSDFGRSLALAEFLSSRELAKVKPVAFIPRTIKGHAVLVAMACEEIVMAPDAEIGEAGIDETTIGPTVRSGYQEISVARRTVPTALALGMLDGSLIVIKAETDTGAEFVLSTDLDQLRGRRVVQKTEELQPRPGFYSGTRARRELGFVSYLASNRLELARALGLPEQTVRNNAGRAGGYHPVQVSIKGLITPEVIRRAQRLIGDQVRVGNANLVIVSIDSAGGDPAESMNFANFLSELDARNVATVAYITHQARSDAALIALGCDQIVMHPGAVIGGIGDHDMDTRERDSIKVSLRDLLKRKDRSWSLPMALIDANLKVTKYSNPARGMTGNFSDEELREQTDPSAWKPGAAISGGGSTEPLLLTGDAAEEAGLTTHTVNDFNEFRGHYGLDDSVALVQAGWADVLIDTLAAPQVRWLLLLLGGAAIYIELHTPGVGLGGFLAIVCFVLYFWSQFLQGTAGWLEVLLFLAGVGCVALEVFVLPGLGIFGIGGGVMIIASLILASQTFVLPSNEYQMEQLRNSLLSLAAAVVGIIIAASVLRRYLPETRLFNQMVLAPPSDAERELWSVRESMVDFTHLVGEVGVTVTPLVPSGKAQFGNELVNVNCNGAFAERGVKVVVTQVQGNRVLVDLLDNEPLV